MMTIIRRCRDRPLAPGSELLLVLLPIELLEGHLALLDLELSAVNQEVLLSPV
jgi:hypothetical protein